jgi:hypothetical protein
MLIDVLAFRLRMIHVAIRITTYSPQLCRGLSLTSELNSYFITAP